MVTKYEKKLLIRVLRCSIIYCQYNTIPTQRLCLGFGGPLTDIVRFTNLLTYLLYSPGIQKTVTDGTAKWTKIAPRKVEQLNENITADIDT